MVGPPLGLLLQLDPTDPSVLSLLLILAGLGLSVAEALSPGAHFIVLGVAMLAAGLVGLVVGPALGPLVGTLVLGLLVLAFGGVALWGYRELDVYGGKGAGRTSDSDALTGKFGRVTERVTPTSGEIKLDSGGFNPYYSARSLDDEIPEGGEVMVVDPGGGNVVTVEAVADFEDEIDRELARGRRARKAEGETRTETESEAERE